MSSWRHGERSATRRSRKLSAKWARNPVSASETGFFVETNPVSQTETGRVFSAPQITFLLISTLSISLLKQAISGLESKCVVQFSFPLTLGIPDNPMVSSPNQAQYPRDSRERRPAFQGRPITRSIGRSAESRQSRSFRPRQTPLFV